MKIVAISACPTGIAHTFMVAGKLEEWGAATGNTVKVETQGSDGQKNKLTKGDIDSADAIILAVDVPIDGEERFEGKKVYKVKTQELLKNFDKHIAAAQNHKNDTTDVSVSEDVEVKETLWETISGHIMGGISFMIPVVVLGGLLIALGAIAQQIIPEEAYIGSVWEQFNNIGGMTMKLMYPFFAGYLAYSIAGKPALIPAFVGGLMCDQLYGKYFQLDPFIPAGFFGAIAIGFLIGYLVRWLNNVIHVKTDYTTIKTMLIVPLIAGVVMVVSMVYVIMPVCTIINTALYSFFTWAGTAGSLLYSTVIAAGTAFDLGGPVNKAAGAVALGFNGTSEAFDLTARTLAIIIPPIGIGVSAWLQKPMKKIVHTKERAVFAKTAMLLGLCGVSEGAIPFILTNPKLIISNITGAIVGSWVAILLGASQALPLPAIWGWPLATNPMAYVAGVVVGALTVGVLTVLLSPRISE